jgi:ABC-type uncharacterized transport system permease subunit
VPVADFWVLVLVGALSSAPPLVLAGLGEVVLERAGAGFNLGIEGMLLAGAFAGVLGGSAAGPWGGAALGLLTGIAFGGLYAAGAAAGIDTVLVGIALTLLGTGLTSYLSQVVSPVGQTNLSVPTLPAVSVPWLDRLPVVGPVFTGTGVAVYLAVALAAATGWTLRATRFGLRLRAAGDDAAVAAVRGIGVRGHRVTAALIAGGFAGLGGAVLVLGSIGTFTPGMTGGRGFVVLAVVILGRRTPAGVLAGALLFSLFDSLALLAQTRDLGLPVEAYQALPYVVTFVALCWHGRRRVRLGRRPHP